MHALLSFYIGAVASFVVGWIVAWRVIGRSPEDAVAIGFACLFSNSLLLGIPILMVVKAVCDRVDNLKSIGELLGD